jgi:hypothetical protein
MSDTATDWVLIPCGFSVCPIVLDLTTDPSPSPPPIWPMIALAPTVRRFKAWSVSCWRPITNKAPYHHWLLLNGGWPFSISNLRYPHTKTTFLHSSTIAPTPPRTWRSLRGIHARSPLEFCDVHLRLFESTATDICSSFDTGLHCYDSTSMHTRFHCHTYNVPCIHPGHTRKN